MTVRAIILGIWLLSLAAIPYTYSRLEAAVKKGRP